MKLRILIFILILITVTIPPATAGISRTYEPVVVSCDTLSDFWGLEVGSLRLYAFDADQKSWSVMPFQIDEVNGEPDDPLKYFTPDDNLLDADDDGGGVNHGGNQPRHHPGQKQSSYGRLCENAVDDKQRTGRDHAGKGPGSGHTAECQGLVVSVLLHLREADPAENRAHRHGRTGYRTQNRAPEGGGNGQRTRDPLHPFIDGAVGILRKPCPQPEAADHLTASVAWSRAEKLLVEITELMGRGLEGVRASDFLHEGCAVTWTVRLDRGGRDVQMVPELEAAVARIRDLGGTVIAHHGPFSRTGESGIPQDPSFADLMERLVAQLDPTGTLNP